MSCAAARCCQVTFVPAPAVSLPGGVEDAGSGSGHAAKVTDAYAHRQLQQCMRAALSLTGLALCGTHAG